jgi:hypothetical protein
MPILFAGADAERCALRRRISLLGFAKPAPCSLSAGGNSFAFPAPKNPMGFCSKMRRSIAALAGFWCAFGLCTGASMIFYRAGLRGAECCIVRYAAVVEPYDEHDPCEPPR